jgi:hypothetical protein
MSDEGSSPSAIYTLSGVQPPTLAAKNKDAASVHPMDEDLSMGTPGWGTRFFGVHLKENCSRG